MFAQEKAIGPGEIQGAGLVGGCHWFCRQVKGWQRRGRSSRGESIGPQEPTKGKELAGRRANLHPVAPSQESGGSHQEAHGSCSRVRGARGVGTGTRACVAFSDAVRTTQCRDLSHSTAGLARGSRRERPGGLIIDTAAAGGRRRQERWRFRYPRGAKREGTAAAEAPDKYPPTPATPFCESTRRLRPSASWLAGLPGLLESWVPGRQGRAGP